MMVLGFIILTLFLFKLKHSEIKCNPQGKLTKKLQNILAQNNFIIEILQPSDRVHSEEESLNDEETGGDFFM